MDINIGLSVTATGTVDAITCTASPAPASLTDKLKYFVKALGANTSTTPTFAPNGLTARTIVKKGGQALVAGDIYGAGAIIILQYDLANTRWELLNPVFTDGLDTYLVQSGNNLLVKSGKYFQSQAYTNGWIYSDANEGSIGFDDGADINSFTAKSGRVYIEQSAIKVFDSAAAGTQLNHGTLINFAAPSVKKNGSELATQSYVDGLVVGLLDDRGSYDASVNTFPASGGSGTAGAILKGDIWYISVAGTLGGSAVTVGDSVRALVDTPGQTATNWSILETNIGYVPENVANKSTDVNTDQASNTKYPSVKSVYDWAVGLFAPLISPSFTTPILGTPTSGNLVNCTGVPISGITGYLGVVQSGSVAILGTPADSTTYYSGGHGLVMAVAQGNRRIYFNKPMTIKGVTLYYLISGVLGSSETFTVSIRVNQTTDTIISSAVTWDAMNIQFTNSGLSLAVVAGDYIEFKHVTPAWATNPTNINFMWNIYAE